MLDIFSQYATDESLENNGTWRDIGGGTELLIARIGNDKYVKHLNKLVEQNKKLLDSGTDEADAKSNEIMVEVLANTILLGWRSKVGEQYQDTVLFKKKAVTYSVKQAKEMLMVKDFRRRVAQLGDEFEAYRLKEEVAQGEA